MDGQNHRYLLKDKANGYSVISFNTINSRLMQQSPDRIFPALLDSGLTQNSPVGEITEMTVTYLRISAS